MTNLAIILYSLRQVYFAKKIDNLLVQLVGPTSNYISTVNVPSRWRSSSQKGRGLIPLIIRSRHILVSVHSQDQDFQRHKNTPHAFLAWYRYRGKIHLVLGAQIHLFYQFNLQL